MLRDPDAVQILIIDDVIFACRADIAADGVCVGFEIVKRSMVDSFASRSVPSPVRSSLPLPGSICVSRR